MAGSRSYTSLFENRAGRPRPAVAPTSRFSSTLRLPKTRRPSGTWMMPALAISRGLSDEMSAPVETDGATLARHTRDGPQRRGLAGAVGPEDADRPRADATWNEMSRTATTAP